MSADGILRYWNKYRKQGWDIFVDILDSK
jgi:hypothetical protein